MKQILVIDDDLLIGRLLREHLSNEGFSVETVTLAEEGFASVLKSPPDLIMLDVNLPDATGFQMCGRFRQNPATRATPIIMMTGAARYPNQQLIGRQLGANDYILKPFDVVKVGEKIHALLGTTSPAAAAPVGTAPAPTPVPAPAAPSVPVNPTPTPKTPIALPVEKTNGKSVPDDRPASVPPLSPVPALADSLTTMPTLSSFSFEANTAPRVVPEESVDPSPVKDPSEPVWYELPLGAIQDSPNAVLESRNAPVELPPSIPTIPTIEFSTEEAPTISAPVEDPRPAEQLEALLIQPTKNPVPEPEAAPAPAPEIEIAPYNDVVIDPPPVVIFPEPVEAPPVKTAASPMRAPAWFSLWRLAWSVVGLHALLFAAGGLIMKAPALWILRGLSFTVGGWAFLLGLLVCTAAALRIALAGREAVEMIGLAALPIVARAAAGVYTAFSEPKAFVHFMGESAGLPAPIFWSHPLDIFQVISLVVIGGLLSRRPGGSFQRALSAAILIGVAWAFLGRGYFKPF